MDARTLKQTRERLTAERDSLLRSINRNRVATEEIQGENTEDEADLANMSHERELLYKLHESDFSRLRFIRRALHAMDRGQYGECTGCGEDINPKRLEAMPWATL